MSLKEISLAMIFHYMDMYILYLNSYYLVKEAFRKIVVANVKTVPAQDMSCIARMLLI